MQTTDENSFYAKIVGVILVVWAWMLKRNVGFGEQISELKGKVVALEDSQEQTREEIKTGLKRIDNRFDNLETRRSIEKVKE